MSFNESHGDLIGYTCLWDHFKYLISWSRFRMAWRKLPFHSGPREQGFSGPPRSWYSILICSDQKGNFMAWNLVKKLTISLDNVLSLAVVIVSLININNWHYLGINNFQLMNQIRTLASQRISWPDISWPIRLGKGPSLCRCFHGNLCGVPCTEEIAQGLHCTSKNGMKTPEHWLPASCPPCPCSFPKKSNEVVMPWCHATTSWCHMTQYDMTFSEPALVNPFAIRKNVVQLVPLIFDLWPLLSNSSSVAVSRGYDTCFRERLVMGYADC